MFKSLVTLFRGAAHEQAETVTDRNALSILDQQMRDCSLSVARARKALAVAIAQRQRKRPISSRPRAVSPTLKNARGLALDAGKEELAAEAAEAIAYLEAESESRRNRTGDLRAGNQPAQENRQTIGTAPGRTAPGTADRCRSGEGQMPARR